MIRVFEEVKVPFIMVFSIKLDLHEKYFIIVPLYRMVVN